MENASKALIMAAGVLIGILILSLAAYLFADFGSTASQMNSQITEQQIAQFNSKFTAYEGQEGLTIYDVITVASYAKENNLYYEDNLSEYEIIVNLGTRDIQDDIDDIKIDLINNDKALISSDNSNLPTYNCKVEGYHQNGRIKEITFYAIKNYL